ncbi:ABC transporter ATP-binding protein [Chelatococcus sambhunathii]|uniref:ABC transporter ATP-binding protein n=1 Tax=Chelatococcus sambhunathii TaxID=363953 RepID=A0ABU1DBK3_9HYPH|nr:ABC transporter ATP-binding protein [Chelatococcus sambhunathii]MDR4305486.1 ABC transporter ATP-binding protein [Chelatococcus sambhunathii]
MLVEVDNLAKRFGGKAAVDDVSFAASAGEIVGLLGANGAGKSTTMRMLVGYLRPDSGTVRIAGLRIEDGPALAQAVIGYLPESATGFPELTVREFLTFAAEARGLRGSARRVALERGVHAGDLAAVYGETLGSLSQGWRQRAWIGQAFLHDPPILVLDEPTTALDPGQKQRLRTLIRDASSTKAVLISTHILEEAETLCDRAIVFREGRISADKPVTELLDDRGRLTHAYQAYAGSG